MSSAFWRGFHVVCLDNLVTGSAANLSHLTASPSFTLINCDITDFFGIGSEVEYVFHLASPASPADYLRFRFRPSKLGALAPSTRWK
jgi:dTDP-glucose 4,6-dehydratase